MNWSHPAYERIARRLKAHTGLYFSEHRREEAETGIRRAMKAAGFAGADRFADMIARDGEIIDLLVVEMAVTESYFFREPRQFEMIRNEALPEIRGRLGVEHTIRAWSAGCAAGQEPYTLAIVCEQEGLADRVRILATDISRSALEQARTGAYGVWSVRNDALALARGRLHSRNGVYEIDDRVRRLVDFQYQNLALDLFPAAGWGIADMDLILCRNVLIYFDPPTIERVARRLFDSLAPERWLITASTDPPLAELASYEIVYTSAGIAYRRAVRGDRRSLRRAGISAPIEGDSNQELKQGATLAHVQTTEAPQRTAISVDRLEAAEAAYAAGDYRLAAQLAARHCDEPVGCSLRVRALANLDPLLAEQTCASATGRHRLSAELHYLHAVLLVGQGRDEEAIDDLRQVTYLDRAQPLAYFTLGSVLQRRGDLHGARRAYRNAHRLCNLLAPDATVPLSDAERADCLAEAADACIAEIEAAEEHVR